MANEDLAVSPGRHASKSEPEQRTLSVGVWVALALGAFALVGMGVYSFFTYHTGYVLALMGVALVVYAAVALLMLRSYIRTGTLGTPAFVVALLGLGLMYCVAFPPGSVPDEGYHFAASYRYSDMLLGGVIDEDTFELRADDAAFREEVVSLQRADRHAFSSMREVGTWTLQDGSPESFTTMAPFDFSSNLPQQKVASSLGIVLARLLNLGSIPLFYLGRAFNLLSFAALAGLAFHICRMGKNIIAVVSMFPMTLHLAASYSYDTAVIGMALVFCALVFSAIASNEELSRGKQAALVIVAVLLAPCKVVYVLLVGLVLLIPADHFGNVRTSRIFKALTILAAVLSLVLVRAGSLLSYVGPDVTAVAGSATAPALDTRGAETGTFYSLGGLLVDPVGSIALFARSLVENGEFYIESTVGGSLGWFQAELIAPDYVTYALVLVLVVATLRASDDRACLTWRGRALAAAIAAAGLLALLLVFALSWTFDTEAIIQGMQGRYLIPFVPVLAIACRPRGVVVRHAFAPIAVPAVVCLNSCLLIGLLGTMLSL